MSKRFDPANIATGERLAVLRKALGYDKHGQQKHFAGQLGLKANFYGMIESGERPLKPDVAIRIKRVFGPTLDWLYCGDEGGLPDRLRRDIHAAITEK